MSNTGIPLGGDLFERAQEAIAEAEEAKRKIPVGPDILRKHARLLRGAGNRISRGDTIRFLEEVADEWEEHVAPTVEIHDPGPVDELQLQINLARDELSDLDAFLKTWEEHAVEPHETTIKRPWWIGAVGMRNHVETTLAHLGGHPYPKEEVEG